MDSAAIQPFGIENGGVVLCTPTAVLRRLRRGELADLLEDPERPSPVQALLAHLNSPPPPMR
jgi:hypothetical protein